MVLLLSPIECTDSTTVRRFFKEGEGVDYEGAFQAFKAVKGCGKEPEYGVLQALVKGRREGGGGDEQEFKR